MSDTPNNFITQNHIHGSPNPRWITEDGRCLLCADLHQQAQIKLLTDHALDLENEVRSKKQEIERLRDWLLKYGDHICDRKRGYEHECTCDWTKLKASLENKEGG